MASIAQNNANRLNSQLSTGPKSEAGKTAMKYNRTCHGLAGKQVVLAAEDAEAYEALRKDLTEAYDPINAAELTLIEEVAQGFWRLQRARSIEAETFNLQCCGADPVIGFRSGREEFDNLRRYMGSIERAYHRALAQLHLEQTTRRRMENETAQPALIRRPQRIAIAPPPGPSLPQARPSLPPEQLSTPLPLAGTPPPS